MLVERCHRVLRVCVAASARRAMRGDGRPVRAGLSAVRVPLACRLPVVCLSFARRSSGGFAAARLRGRDLALHRAPRRACERTNAWPGGRRRSAGGSAQRGTARHGAARTAAECAARRNAR
ncbi:hypothetical protein BURPS1710A_A2379 [Burkholderia pseudomallei 1710a]|uniref:Uncharacterized protein n=2 Tax=Burkholderia pseudomallei TaxID=28450 RepID=A0A0E1VQB2_BURPE|nr:hypothetical protein BURPS1710A_A2379 [Burkholderia pseudomallei 1710a]